MELAKNAAVDLGISFGEIILPVVMELINKLKSVVEWLSNLSPSMQKTIVIIAAVVAAIGPLLIIIGGVSSGLSTLVSGLGVLSKFLFGTTESVGVLGKAMGFLAANPIVLIIAAIAALVAGFIYLWNTNEEFRNFFIDCWNSIKEFMVGIWEWFAVLFTETIPSIFSSLTQWIATVFTTDWTTQFGAFGYIMNAFSQNVRNIWNAIKTIFNGIIEFVKNVFTGNWKGAWEAVKDIFRGIFELLVGYAKTPLNMIIGFINTVISGINTLINKINEFMSVGDDLLAKIGVEPIRIGNIPKIPMLAKGGVLSSGSAIVGEAGAELLSMVNGRAVVTPLTDQQKQSTARTINQTNHFYNYKPRDGAATVRDLNRQLGEAY